MPTKVCLQFDPKQLVGDLPYEERVRTPVLLDVSAGCVDEQCTCFELTVSFHQIKLQSWGIPIPASYYVGAVGATLWISAAGAAVIDHYVEDPVIIPAEYGKSIVTENAQGKKIMPEIKINSGIESKVGGVEINHTEQQSATSKFTFEEHLTVPSGLGNTVCWYIHLHRADSIVRDFLIGDKRFKATFRWKLAPRKGQVHISPDILLFDSLRRPLSKRASFMMRFLLWRKVKKEVANVKGFDMSFVETKWIPTISRKP